MEIIRSKRKTITIQIFPDGRISVRAPLRTGDSEIQRFVDSKSGWIEAHLREINSRPRPISFTDSELESMRASAKEIIPPRVEYFARLIGVEYNRITIKKMSTRWGSCSSKNNLNFSLLLSACPSEIVDYIVIHELCHLKELNHSPAFWSLVSRYCPDYKKHKLWLKKHGNELIARLNK